MPRIADAYVKILAQWTADRPSLGQRVERQFPD